MVEDQPIDPGPNGRAVQRRRRISAIAQAYRESNEVMSAAMAVALLAGGGYWLDLRLGCKPMLTICGLLLGCGMAAASLRQLLIRLDEQSRERRKTNAGLTQKDGPTSD